MSPSPQSIGTTSPLPSAPAERAFQAGNGGQPTALALSPDAFYVLFDTPSGLLASNRVGPGVMVTTIGLPEQAAMLADDQDAGRLWVIGGGDHGSAQAYEPNHLKPEAPPVQVPVKINQVAAGHNTLWLATANGLYYLRGLGPPIRVPGIDGAVGAVSTDPAPTANSQVMAAVSRTAGEDLFAVDSASARVIKHGHLPLVNVSLAATEDGIWYAGYGDPGGYGGFGKLDADTLAPSLDLTSQLKVGPGATIWAGTSVVWVSSDGSGLMSCVSASNGSVLQTWPDLTGPVVSDPAYQAAVGLKSVRLLIPTAECAG